jgi:pimeloyl-ACP methyl ester carboxylesterase
MLTVDGMTTQEHFIQANGLNIYYQEVGTGEPLILLHGGTATGDSWEDYIGAFARHFRVLVLDWRGHGKTDNPTGEFSYRLVTDDIVAFIEALGLNKPFICGYSDGGQIALDLGIRYRDLAEALVIGAATYKFKEPYYEHLRGMGFEALGRVDTVKMGQGWTDYLKEVHPRNDTPDYWNMLVNQISHMWWQPLGYSDEDLKTVTAPSLIILGDRDGFVLDVEQAVEMYRLMPNAELAVIPEANHLNTMGELFGKIVLDFLLRHSTSAEKPAS